jgi:hypothetical protein
MPSLLGITFAAKLVVVSAKNRTKRSVFNDFIIWYFYSFYDYKGTKNI